MNESERIHRKRAHGDSEDLDKWNDETAAWFERIAKDAKCYANDGLFQE